MARELADHDADGDERRAERRALRRLVPRLGRARWLVDLGGGHGRHAGSYRTCTDRYVIIDHSAANLRNAAGAVGTDLAAGRAFLVRADLNALPFVDAAFDTGLVVRVLHHVPDVATTLAEMGRIVGGAWLVDVPVRHHALPTVRRLLTRAGFLVARRTGGGWWGPNRFVLAERPYPLPADTAGDPRPGSPAIAALMCCPRCRGRLSWTTDTAVCPRCRRRYERTDGFWDFTVDAPVLAFG
jgi:SAM-dependent methyltransferase